MKSSAPNSQPSSSPQLAPPGAGLPWPQRLLLRYILGPWVSSRADWEDSLGVLSRRQAKLAAVWASIPADRRHEKILVPPQPGLEDSSRYWSADMVVEHLGIVGARVEFVVSELSQGRVPSEVVDTAQVKPKGQAAGEAVDRMRHLEAWVESATTKLRAVDARSRQSKATLVHPWFGPFRALQWVWLLGEHHGIHLRQLREIRKGLAEAAARSH